MSRSEVMHRTRYSCLMQVETRKGFMQKWIADSNESILLASPPLTLQILILSTLLLYSKVPSRNLFLHSFSHTQYCAQALPNPSSYICCFILRFHLQTSRQPLTPFFFSNLKPPFFSFTPLLFCRSAREPHDTISFFHHSLFHAPLKR